MFKNYFIKNLLKIKNCKLKINTIIPNSYNLPPNYMWSHTPVLTKELMSMVDLKSGDDAVDATVGGGGHTIEILKATSPSGKLLALDTDPKSLKIASEILKKIFLLFYH